MNIILYCFKVSVQVAVFLKPPNCLVHLATFLFEILGKCLCGPLLTMTIQSSVATSHGVGKFRENLISNHSNDVRMQVACS